MTLSTNITELPSLPKYSDDIPVVATRSRRGGGRVYTLTMNIGLALDLLPKPDPNIPFPNNRPLVVKHSEQWGNYWEKNPDNWGCPAGLVSVRADFGDSKWQRAGDGNSAEIGVLSLPRTLSMRAEILDMQHRIYGFHLKRIDLSDRLRKAQDELQAAKKLDDAPAAQRIRVSIDKLEQIIARFEHETITFEIVVLSEEDHRTLFAIIADRALAISRSQIADYDSTQVLNRVAHTLADQHPLLVGKVDWVRNKVTDTKTKKNPNFISGDTLVNLVRPFATGNIVGRVPAGRNEDLAREEGAIYTKMTEFFDVLAAAFEPLGGIMGGTVRPADVREDSLLGSSTVLRALAAAYYDLTRDRDGRGRTITPKMQRAEVLAFFKKLAPYMGLPLSETSGWFTTFAFPPPQDAEGNPREVRAPSSRNQDMKMLSDAVIGWATFPERFPFAAE